MTDIDLSKRCKNCLDEDTEHKQGRCAVVGCSCIRFEPVVKGASLGR